MANKPSLNNVNNFVAPVKPGNKLLGFVLIVVAAVVAAYISMVLWVEKRTLFEKLTYKPMTEQVATSRASTLKITQATELQVVSGSTEKKINVQKGTSVKLLGVYMTRLNYRSDPCYDCSPQRFTDDQYFFIELPNGVRGAAKLPELSGHWNEYSSLYYNGETVVYTCPLAGVPADKQHKAAHVPSIMKIPTHESDGFFLFPRFKKWNMFKVGSWWRGRFMLGVYWLLLIIILLWRLSASSINLSVKADRKFIENPALNSKQVYEKIVNYYWPRYFPRAFLVGCVATPLVWLWTKINRESTISSLTKELGNERCPKCGKLGLDWKFTGNQTTPRSLGITYFEGGTYSYTTQDYSGPKVWDPDQEKMRFRTKTITTTYAPGSYELFEYKKEYVVTCSKCGAVIQRGWETQRYTGNRKGGEELRQYSSLEPVQYGYIKKK